MAGRARNNTNRIETDIEKSREESNWKRVIDLAEQLKTRSKNYECLSNFLIGEGRLESYLEEHPPIEANMVKARLGLVDAKKYLEEAANEMGRKAGVALDAHLLLGKLYYACGEYKESLESYNNAELHTLTEKPLPLRSLRIVAESFAIKGLCLEREDPTGTRTKTKRNFRFVADSFPKSSDVEGSTGNRFKQTSREQELYRCFELASDLSLLYLQEFDKLLQSGPTSISVPNNKSMGVIMDTALQRAPILYILAGRPAAAIDRYRATLSAVESTSTYGLRLTLSRQLAEVLLRYINPDFYNVPEDPMLNKKSPYHLAETNEMPWKPKKYMILNQFIPSDVHEEVILLLLISESMAVHNAVLSQSPEFREARIKAHQNATAVYDLLTLGTVRWGQTSLLHESFERAMKFSFEEPHVWHQEALCLISMGRYTHALAMLKEVHRLEPTLTSPCLLAAKICYENVIQPEKGTDWSLKALHIEKEHPRGLLSRCYIYVGIGYQIQAANGQLKNLVSSLNHMALTSFQAAVSEDPNDHLAEYYCSLQLALMNRISEALVHVKQSLNLRPESAPALQLLALLLSASRQHMEALKVVTSALEEYPDCLNLMNLKAHLELHEFGGEVALITAKKMLTLWKNQFEHLTSVDAPECDRRSDNRSVFQLYTSEISDKDSSSLQAHSVAASRVEQALSEAATSLSNFNPKPGPQRAWQLLLQIWLLLAELYLSLDQVVEAEECVKRASEIYPLSHHIMHLRGLIHVHKQDWIEAKLCFQNSVAVNPRYVKSLQQLGLVYHYLGSQRVAETTLRDAAKIDPTSHMTWYILGTVLETLEDYEAASNSMATALSVEITCPILPFTTVPHCFE